MSQHAQFSPSGAKKWMACPGSVAMEFGEPDDSNEYSDEGTAAHALAAMCLTENRLPAAFLGRQLRVVDGVYDPTGQARVLKTQRTFPVDAGMVEHVTTYVLRVREYAERGELLVEERVPIGHITDEEDAEGTADGVVVLSDGATLEFQVHDLKFGRGVPVSAVKNPQGMFYLLGALQKFEPIYGRPSRLRFVIHQPRRDYLGEWDCTYDELMAFAAEARERAKVARFAFEQRLAWMPKKETGYLTPGQHCDDNFCKARAKCPALAKFVTDSVGADFEVLALTQPTDGSFKALIPTDLNALGEKYKAIEIISDWCKQIRAKVEAALFENNNSDKAQAALGCKLVEGKKGNRAWNDPDAAAEALKKMRLKVGEIYDFSLKTPPSIEKVLKEKPKRWAAMVKLISQKPGVPSVAELTDKRPPWAVKPTADDFATDGSDLI